MMLRKPLDAIRTAARAEVDAAFGRRLADAMGPLSAIRAAKAAAADAVLAGASSAPLLEPEAAAKGIALTELAQVIRARAEACNRVVGRIEADRQLAQAKIDAAASPVEIETILQSYR